MKCCDFGEPSLSPFSLEFLTRNNCGAWHVAYEVLYAFSSFAIFSAYIAIVAILLSAAVNPTKDYDKTFKDERSTMFCYVAFIFFCGVGHLEGFLSFIWPPPYHFWALWHFVTACVSWWGVYKTFKLRMAILNGRLWH